MSVRDGLRIATMGGARVLGRQHEIGSLEPGKLADIAVWQVDRIEHAGILDPVAALGLGALPPLKRLYVGGQHRGRGRHAGHRGRRAPRARRGRGIRHPRGASLTNVPEAALRDGCRRM